MPEGRATTRLACAAWLLVTASDTVYRPRYRFPSAAAAKFMSDRSELFAGGRPWSPVPRAASVSAPRSIWPHAAQRSCPVLSMPHAAKQRRPRCVSVARAAIPAADLAAVDGHAPLLREVEAIFGPLAMFVHSASPPRRAGRTVDRVDGPEWDAMRDTNLGAGFFLARGLAERLVAGGLRGRMLFVAPCTRQHRATWRMTAPRRRGRSWWSASWRDSSVRPASG